MIMRLHETLKAFPVMGCSPPLKAQNVHAVSHVFPSSRGGRSKPAATKENDSSEEVDVFQGGSPVHDDIPQEEAEEEEVSTVNVRVY